MASVRKRGRLLIIDFYCQLPDGRRARCIESTDLEDNKKNRANAKAKCQAIQYELKQGTFNYLHFFPFGSKARIFREHSIDQTLSIFWEQWINEKVIRKNTRRALNSAWNYIEPALGNIPLPKINETEILQFRKNLISRGLSISTVNRYISQLCECLKRANRRGLINIYPCQDIRNIRGAKKAADPFTFDELKAFLTFLSDKYPDWHDLILIWSRTGLRPGEIYALRWDKIDYFNEKILIDQTRDGGVDGPPKTETSRRFIDMRPPVRSALKRQEARTRLKSEFIFLTHRDQPLNRTWVNDKFHHLLALAGIRYRSPGQLRHTFASLHLAAGENISWVSRMMGHANAQTTWKRYNQFLPNLTRQDGSAFERIMDSPIIKNEELERKKNNE